METFYKKFLKIVYRRPVGNTLIDLFLEQVIKNPNQDIIKLENNKPSIIQTISIKKTSNQQLYNNPLR